MPDKRPSIDANVPADLWNYCHSQPGLLLLPIEQLSPDGISQAMQAMLLDQDLLTAAQLTLFNKAYRFYWQRTRRLYQKARQYWFPPRIQHICLVTDSELIRPYFQPFNKNSWLLYLDDFDPASSSIEFAAYQFLHVERMWLLGRLDPVMYTNLSYFLTLSAEQVEDFITGCRRNTRPDSDAFQILADSMPSIRKLYHDPLKKPTVAAGNLRGMRDTGLGVSADLIPVLQQLQQSWSQTTVKVTDKFRNAHIIQSAKPGQSIMDWLQKEKPALLITGKESKILWDPERPDEIAALRTVLNDVTQSAEPDILLDLHTIARHTCRFLDCLQQPEQLADPAAYMTEGGLSYIHNQRKLIAYNLGTGRHADRLWQPAPPYERLMLAARTVHEWGHLAAESGWVLIPEENQERRKTLENQLAELFDRLHQRAPARVQKQLAQEVARLSAETGSLGRTLLKRMLVRIEDFMANLVAARFLSADEMDTYVRNNVHCHLQDYSAEGVYMQLIRLAYEFQYLGLSRIKNPLQWFYSSTWFVEYFIDNGVISKPLFEELIKIVGEICDCYQLDESQFNFEQL